MYIFLEEKREKVLRTLSSFGHPLKQPLKEKFGKKGPMSGLFSKQSLCVWGKEEKETDGIWIYEGRSRRQKTKVLDPVSQ